MNGNIVHSPSARSPGTVVLLVTVIENTLPLLTGILAWLIPGESRAAMGEQAACMRSNGAGICLRQ